MHPFLICKTSDYTDLRDRAARAPWSDMLTGAHSVIDAFDGSLPDNLSQRGFAMRDLTGSAALLYVVDESARSRCRDLLVRLFDHWPAILAESDDVYDNLPNKWSSTVPMSSGYFNSVLALDVIHDDLAPGELNRVESIHNDIADWFWKEMRGWACATYGPRAIWSLYRGDDRLQLAMDQYRGGVAEQMTVDGVGTNGGEYSVFRMNGQRTAKWGFMHLAEYTGVDPVYYDNPSIGAFYEWVHAAACAPFNTCVTFADSGHDIHFARGYPLSGAWLAHRFSHRAAELAAYRVASSGARVPSDLLTYCATLEPLPEPRVPESQVWTDGGALFHENNPTDQALTGQLWNVSEPTHSHFDANAVYLAGYGEDLLLNSGYNGWGNGFDRFTWEDIHDSAVVNNVILVNGANHLEKGADGITESLIAPGFDYACGRADRAYQGSTVHNRSFAFVHPWHGAPGWFFLVDEVESPGKTVDLALHPASSEVTVDAASESYTWTVRRRKATDTRLTVHLATPPGSVDLREGPLTGHSESFVGTYLFASYPGAGSRSSILTLLLPHDDEHPRPDVTRLSDGHVSAARLRHANGVIDTVASTSAPSARRTEGAGWDARSILFRAVDGELAFYAALGGTSFSIGDNGFESDRPISLYISGSQGIISVSSATTVTFERPGLRGVSVNGEAAASPTVQLPPGLHTLSLAT